MPWTCEKPPGMRGEKPDKTNCADCGARACHKAGRQCCHGEPGLAGREAKRTGCIVAKHEDIEPAAKGQDISWTEWFSINAKFHETIVAWSNNRFPVQSLERQNSLRRMTELSDFSHLSERRLREAAQEHLAILRAIEAGDFTFASALLRRHLTRASSVALDAPRKIDRTAIANGAIVIVQKISGTRKRLAASE
jgi:hypothetical protein